MHEFDAYWKATGRIEPRDSTIKEQMRIAFRAGRRLGAAESSARVRLELVAAISGKRREWGMPSEGVHGDREIGAASAFAAVLGALDRIIPEEP